MSHENITSKKELFIDNIVFIRSFESMNDFIPEEECYHFWTFLYVDKGTINVAASSGVHTQIGRASCRERVCQYV